MMNDTTKEEIQIAEATIFKEYILKRANKMTSLGECF